MNREKTVQERHPHMTLEENNTPIDQLRFRKYMVSPGQVKFEIGDFVKPDTIVGLDYKTGQPVKAEINGRITTIYHSPTNGSVIMLIVSGDD